MITPLDIVYSEYVHAKAVKENKVPEIDWNTDVTWVEIVESLCLNLEFKWSKGENDVIYLYFLILPNTIYTEAQDAFTKKYFKETMVLKLYPDGHSYMGELVSNIAETEKLEKFIYATDAFSLPNSLVKSFAKIKELIDSPFQPEKIKQLKYQM